MIKELARAGGTYLIVSTKDDCSDEALNRRRAAIAKCLTEHAVDRNVLFDFYDSRRIADWVEQHPSIVTWLRSKIGKPLTGWRPYGPWAYREHDLDSRYLIDDRVRVFIPNSEKGITASAAISHLRTALSQPGISVRIVGLSGVGKTRLVQALFDERVNVEMLALPVDDVIYVDVADGPNPKPQDLLNSLFEKKAGSVVVVDNCPPHAHNQLTEIIKKPDCLLRLITVEYDIRDDLPEETLCYRLEGASLETVEQLVKLRYLELSNADATRIAEFSDGNARVAFALASTVENGGELSRLQDRDLFERLFLQKNDPDQELLRCAEAASLVYSFDGDDLTTSGEMVKLAAFAEVSVLKFSRNLAELQRRGMLPARGKWRAILPQAIANGLATRMSENVPEQFLYSALFEGGCERLARSFTRRLGDLRLSR